MLNKTRFFVLFLFISMMFMFAPSVFASSGSSWMNSIDDSRSLSSLSIPGTHDSGAIYEPIYNTAKCQDLNIAEQLSIGVRYLDIRNRHYENSFDIYHGPISQNQTFDDVLHDVYSFLDDNPSETILMGIKEEYNPYNNTRSFEETFDAYIANNPDKWLLTDTIPTVGEARGKIVLIRRFEATELPKGIDATDWKVNTTFTIHNTAKLKVQDYYKVTDSNQKWSDIQSMYQEATIQNPSWLYINYTSGYKPGWFDIPNIRTMKDNINPKVDAFFTSNTQGRYGISAMDFITSDLASKIIATNF
ncbi:phosphatidylinositol-specific phospholipase C [Aquibacillus rhizosphaerae]|uniref:1-phosphatidylinositol phosphodiesterase n=1 Tax=Aquibacillus rhizosphaerae TaxID=3051431 RepID=A0ABT7LBG7_9BACI|nr:phosphatidylinositol-specific phospholipase C [Aquibacillus sp. LR5S19]MDL4842525.1 phosphatidylinositol-specific phospholipase C [Aquibacillus sp. LR5S19]